MKWFLTLLLLFFSLTPTGFANEQKWLDSSFAFPQVQRVLVLQADLHAIQADELLTKQLRQVYLDEAKLKNASLVYEQEILDVIATEQGKSIEQLAEVDAVSLYKMFEEEAKKRADVIVFAYVTKYETGLKHVPEQITTKTEYEEVVVKDSKGNQNTVRYPVTRTEVVPAKDLVTITASVMFRVTDLQSGKEVLLFEDQRYREPTVFEEQTPVNMYKRISKKFYSDLDHLLK